MTIERNSFKPAMQIREEDFKDIANLLLFSEKTIIPPDYKLDITPDGNKDDKCFLITKNRSAGIEDTVGEITTARGQKAKVDEHTPVVSIATPALSPEHDKIVGLKLNEIIRYIPADKNNAATEQQAREALYQQFQTLLRTAVPVQR